MTCLMRNRGADYVFDDVRAHLSALMEPLDKYLMVLYHIYKYICSSCPSLGLEGLLWLDF